MGGAVKNERLAALAGKVTRGETGYAYVIDSERNCCCPSRSQCSHESEYLRPGRSNGGIRSQSLWMVRQVLTDMYSEGVDTYGSYAPIPIAGWGSCGHCTCC